MLIKYDPPPGTGSSRPLLSVGIGFAGHIFIASLDRDVFEGETVADLTLRELQQLGIKGLQEFMKLSNSQDPYLANAVVAIGKALVLADRLNISKDKASKNTAELKAINEALNEIRQYTPTGTDPNALMTLPAKGTAERTAIILRWKAVGINITESSTPKQSDSTAWQTILSTKSDTVSSGSQRDQLDLQTILTRYNEGWDLATTLFKAYESSGEKVTGNFR
ncbi:hypothetical protein [Lacisediminimonas sp.]|uniref:hypothetical protein n=1 Tax=Lacisediminimonas sp. TaxID=3060582 RepID=UPI002728F78B|nr:hypothetical protein [Lacisediminimonas sp.]MDO8300188.1 hypothetical protein [Lacisediminimonas sp.]